MNLKKAKTLRRHVRMLMGMDPRHKVYAAQTTHTRLVPLIPQLPPIEVQITNPIRLLPCGRKRYQLLKRSAVVA